MEKTLAWVLSEDAPDSLYAELQAAGSLEETLAILILAKEKGWVKILGVVKGSPADVKAVIQEHFEVKVVSQKKKENRRKLRHGSEKRLE